MIRRLLSRGVLGVAVLVFLGKVTGLVRDLLIGTTYGVSAMSDAYFFAAALTGLLYIGIYGAIPLVLVPALSASGGPGGGPPPNRIVAVVLGASSVLALTLGALALLGVPFSTGLGPETRLHLREYLPLMAATFLLSSAVAIANAAQVWRGRTLWSYATPVVNNVVFGVAVLMTGAGAGLRPALVASIVGWLVLAILNQGSLGQDAGAVRPELPDRGQVRATLILAAPVTATLYVEQAYSFIGTYAATHIPGHGVTQWALASRLAFVAVSVFGVVLATSVFPRFARLAAEADPTAFGEFAAVTGRRILLICAPFAAVGLLYASDAVALLVRRGRISPTDSDGIAMVVAVLLLGLPFGLLRDLFSRGTLASRRAGPVLWASIGAALFLAGAATLGVLWGGLAGLATAYVVAQLFQAGAFLRVFERQARVSVAWPLIGQTLRVGLAAGGAGLSMIALRQGVRLPWPAEAALCLVVYGLFAGIFGDPDVRRLGSSLRRLVRSASDVSASS